MLARGRCRHGGGIGPGGLAGEAPCPAAQHERVDVGRAVLPAQHPGLSVPRERVVTTVARHGNTSAASVPLALDKSVRDGRVQPGHLLLLEGVGGGMTWGSVLLRW